MRPLPAVALLVGCAAFGEQVTPLVAPAESAGWDRARDAARLSREFVANTIATAEDAELGAVLDWAFTLREGGFADIFLRRPVAEPFARLRLKVRNLGEKLTLGVKVADANGAEWTPRQVPLEAGGPWRTVEFPLPDWQVASWSKDADGRLSFPLSYLAVIAFGVKPGPAYRLQVGEVSLVRPDPGTVVVSASGLPERMPAGRAVDATLTIKVIKPLPTDGYSGRDAELRLMHGKAVVAQSPVVWSRPPEQWQPGEPVTGRASLATSRWLPGGEYCWRLYLPGALIGPEDAPGPVTIEGRAAKPPTAVVKSYHGAPTLFINDRPVPAMAYAAYGPSSEVFADFAAAGVRLFSVMGTPSSHGYGLAVDTWTGPGEYDYSQLDARFRMVLEESPEAWLFPRLYVSAPPWWLDQHPEAVVLYDPGDGRPVPFIQNGRKVPSWSSPAWRAATIDALKKLIAHVGAQPYADRVIGYHIASGTTEEWMMWGANDNQWTDYSPDNTAAFRRWLAGRYRTDAALQAAWGDPAVKLATATVPPRKARETSAAGVLRSPATDTPAIDYVRYIADMTAETIDLLCGAAKQATGGRRLAGVFYGYLLQLFGQRQQNAAHLGLDAVLRSPNIDFLCSPTSYAYRAVGTGVSHFMAPLGSVLAHGKLWLDENDIRTSLAPGKLGEWGRQADVAGDMLQQDRELANVLVHGVGQWWFDVGRNRYDDQRLMAHLGKLSRVAARTLDFDRTPADDVALVVDGRGLASINVGDPLMNPLMLEQMASMARLGAAVGHYELNDVARLERHRMILFAGLYEPTAAQREAIERLKGNGRVLVFTHAPGPYTNGRWTPEAMSSLAGLRLTVEDRALPARVAFANDPLTAGLEPVYGPERPVRPTIVGADPEAVVLGRLTDGTPGLLLRRYADWTAVWSAAPNLPAGLLARLAEAAGAHRYVTSPEVVWASRELLAVSAREGGRKLIHLRQPAKVTDLYADRLVAERASSFEVELPAGGTGLWRVEAVR